MIKYNNILERLKEAGYNTKRIREERLLSEPTMTAIRRNKNITTESLDKICSLLECQPGELLTWYSDEDDGYTILDNMYIQFVEEDLEDARRDIMRTSREVENFFLLWKSGKRNEKELDSLSDAILRRSLCAVDRIKTAQKNLEELKKLTPQIFIKSES